MRKDGLYRFYIIERFGGTGSGKKEWMMISFDNFGDVEGFKASNQCWQETGIMGCYDFVLAVKGLEFIRKKHPKETWRLTLKTILQLSDVEIGPVGDWTNET